MANISRRKIVTALGVGATVSLAGCNGNSNTDGSDGSDGSDETDSSDGSNGSDGEDISVEDLPEGFSETGVEDLQTALGSDSAFYDQTVIETEFTITQGSATVENYHYANHDEKLLFQEQVVPSRTRQNYYTDGTYYVYTSAEGVDPQYNVEDVEWQRSVMYYFPPTNLLASGEFTLEQTEEGFRYVTEDTENAEFMGQVSQLVQSSQSGGDSETDPVSEFSAEFTFTSEGVPTGFNYTVVTESGSEENGDATYSYETVDIEEPSWISEAEAQTGSSSDGEGGSTDGSGDSNTGDGTTGDSTSGSE